MKLLDYVQSHRYQAERDREAAMATAETEINELIANMSVQHIFCLFRKTIDLKPDDHARLEDVMIDNDGELSVDLDITFAMQISLSKLLGYTGQEHRKEELTKLLTPALQR